METDIFFWWSIISTVLGVILLCFSIGQLVVSLADKKRHTAQVKIWHQDTSGLTNGLQVIKSDINEGKYTSVGDVGNAISALNASAYSLYQSLLEERVLTEKEVKEQYLKRQEELQKLFAGNQQEK